MDFRRKANPRARVIQQKPSQPERSGELILDMAHRKVAGRGKPRSPARQAGPTDSSPQANVGPACRAGLSPQGEPMGTRYQSKTEPTRTIRRA